MRHLFDIAQLEADIFSDEELQAIDDYVGSELREEAGLEEEDDDFPALELELTMADGSQLTCQAVGVFLEGDTEYIALHPKDDKTDLVFLMILEQGEEDSICLKEITDNAELAAAEQAFHRYLGDDSLGFEEKLELEDEASQKEAAPDELPAEEALQETEE